MTQTTQPNNVLTTGQLTWTGGGTTVRSPIAVTPTVADALATVSGSGAAGSISFPVTSGQADLPVEAYGLAHGKTYNATLTYQTDSQRFYRFTVSDSTIATQVVVRSTRKDAVVNVGTIANLDDPNKAKFVNGLPDGTGRVDTAISNLPPGTYEAVALGNLGCCPPTGTKIKIQTQINLVDRSDANGTLKVTPSVVSGPAGTRRSIKASWTGADVHTPSAGYIRYGGSDVGTFVGIN